MGEHVEKVALLGVDDLLLSAPRKLRSSVIADEGVLGVPCRWQLRFRDPHFPDMAGYSGTPLPRKLGIKANLRVGLVRPPDDFMSTLGELPAGTVPRLVAKGCTSFDIIICFVRTLKEVERDVVALRRRLDPAGGLWFAWPKKTAAKSAGILTDVRENEIRARGLAAGLVDNKVCAIDDVWSGLRFVVRLADR